MLEMDQVPLTSGGILLVFFPAVIGTSWKNATSVLFVWEAVTCLSCFIWPKLNEETVAACQRVFTFLCSRVLLRTQPLNYSTTISKCISILQSFLLLKGGCNEQTMVVRTEQLRPKWVSNTCRVINTVKQIGLQLVRKHYSTFSKLFWFLFWVFFLVS